MSLQSIVTNTLPEKQKRDLLQISQFSADPYRVLTEGRSLQSACAHLLEDVAPLVASYASLGGEGRADSLLALRLLHALSSGDHQPLQEALRLTNNRLELFLMLRFRSDMLDYLQDCWGKNFEENLSIWTRTRATTVHGWIHEGKNPSQQNQDMIRALSILFYQLRVECGMSRAEAARWMQNTCVGSQSVENILVRSMRYGWGASDFPGNLQKALISEGADEEALLPSFSKFFCI